MAAGKWTADRIPDLTGRTFVVTGANRGLGLAMRQLARCGTRVRLWRLSEDLAGVHYAFATST